MAQPTRNQTSSDGDNDRDSDAEAEEVFRAAHYFFANLPTPSGLTEIARIVGVDDPLRRDPWFTPHLSQFEGLLAMVGGIPFFGLDTDTTLAALALAHHLMTEAVKGLKAATDRDLAADHPATRAKRQQAGLLVTRMQGAMAMVSALGRVGSLIDEAEQQMGEMDETDQEEDSEDEMAPEYDFSRGPSQGQRSARHHRSSRRTSQNQTTPRQGKQPQQPEEAGRHDQPGDINQPDPQRPDPHAKPDWY
jgi:hypothetical protein